MDVHEMAPRTMMNKYKPILSPGTVQSLSSVVPVVSVSASVNAPYRVSLQANCFLCNRVFHPVADNPELTHYL